MSIDILLQLVLADLNNTSALNAIYQKVVAEKRDLTEDEVGAVRVLALQSNVRAQNFLDSMPG